eukprot:11393855-Alexandrium_andersonii.AAC.1
MDLARRLDNAGGVVRGVDIHAKPVDRPGRRCRQVRQPTPRRGRRAPGRYRPHRRSSDRQAGRGASDRLRQTRERQPPGSTS